MYIVCIKSSCNFDKNENGESLTLCSKITVNEKWRSLKFLWTKVRYNVADVEKRIKS